MQKTEVLIIGAGLSGLYMGFKLKFKNRNFIVCDESNRTKGLIGTISYLHKDISNSIPIDFKQIEVQKGCIFYDKFYGKSDMTMMNSFAIKSIGKLSMNSVKFIDGKNEIGYYPVNNSMNEISDYLEVNIGCENILLNKKLVAIDTSKKIAYFNKEMEPISYKYLISTVPLPYILSIIGIRNDVSFDYNEIKLISYGLPYNSDVYQIVYDCDLDNEITRYSLINNYITIECKDLPPCDLEYRANSIFFLEIDNLKFIGETKIKRFVPISSDVRKHIMRKLTDDYRILCLGRYATWSYKRFDHVIDDANSIIKTIESIG